MTSPRPTSERGMPVPDDAARDQRAPSPDSLTSLFEPPDPALVVASPAQPASIRRSLRTLLSGRSLLAVVALTPLAYLTYRGALGAAAVEPAWLALVGVMSVLAAMTVTTYLPRRVLGGSGSAAASPCAAIGGLYVVFAAYALNGRPTTLADGVLALGLVGFGLLQRLRGAAACGV